MILQKYRALNVLGIRIRGLRGDGLLLLLCRFLRIHLGQRLLTRRHLLGIVGAVLLVHGAHVGRLQSQQSHAVTSFHALLCSRNNRICVTRFSNAFLIKSVSYRLDFANRPPTSRRRLGTASRPHHFHHVHSPVLHHRASRRWTFCVYCVLPEKNIRSIREKREIVITCAHLRKVLVVLRRDDRRYFGTFAHRGEQSFVSSLRHRWYRSWLSIHRQHRVAGNMIRISIHRMKLQMITRINVFLSLLTILLLISLIILLNRMPKGFGGLRGYVLLLVSRLHYDVGCNMAD